MKRDLYEERGTWGVGEIGNRVTELFYHENDALAPVSEICLLHDDHLNQF